MTESEVNRKEERKLQDLNEKEAYGTSIRKNFAIAAPYQALIGGILLLLIWAILNPLDGMDLMYPYFHIPTFPTFRVIGTIVIIIAALQLLYAILFPKLLVKNSKTTILIGKIFASLMLPIIPTGTYFGLLIWQDIYGYENERHETPQSTPISDIKTTMISSALLMLHMPIILLLFYVFIITMPIDMAYPVMAAVATTLWGNISWVLFFGFILQMLFGILYPKLASKKGSNLTIKSFALFQILSLGIFFLGFIWISAPAFGLTGASMVIVFFSWIIGVILNPIGVHFGLALWRQAKKNN